MSLFEFVCLQWWRFRLFFSVGSSCPADTPQIPSLRPFFVQHVCLSLFSLCVSFPFMICLLHFRNRLLSCKLLAVKFDVRTHTNSVSVLDSGRVFWFRILLSFCMFQQVAAVGCPVTEKRFLAWILARVFLCRVLHVPVWASWHSLFTYIVNWPWMWGRCNVENKLLCEYRL